MQTPSPCSASVSERRTLRSGASRGRAAQRHVHPAPAGAFWGGLGSPRGLRLRPPGAAGASPAAPWGAPGQGHLSATLQRLHVRYAHGEAPMSEILRLGGGQGKPVVVEAVASNSKAARAGVSQGCTLSSINGHTDFGWLPGWQVHLLLSAPVVLEFVPPLQAADAKCTEIRLKRPGAPIGLPPGGPLVEGSLAETVTFQPGSAPLWLRARDVEPAGSTVPVPTRPSRAGLPRGPGPGRRGPAQRTGDRRARGAAGHSAAARARAKGTAGPALRRGGVLRGVRGRARGEVPRTAHLGEGEGV
ncbi:unnamed protein product [Prorocentrum cordatum]|uniref:PDZ domain-containing protein n=1 Tax=Prorocentrum cordatum TaxID=2364126 RepID=A0ABN9VB31_9DINO|nr:unnamed protein product [Polarella glacialis]